jgi:hypothetical protein
LLIDAIVALVVALACGAARRSAIAITALVSAVAATLSVVIAITSWRRRSIMRPAAVAASASFSSSLLPLAALASLSPLLLVSLPLLL